MLRLDHVNIRAHDQEAVRDFLVAVLKLEVGARPSFDFPGYWLYLGDQAIVHLQGADAPNRAGGWIDHVAFGPFDLAAKSAELDAAGVQYKVGGVPGRGLRQIFVEGPEGVRLELQCPE